MYMYCFENSFDHATIQRGRFCSPITVYTHIHADHNWALGYHTPARRGSRLSVPHNPSPLRHTRRQSRATEQRVLVAPAQRQPKVLAGSQVLAPRILGGVGRGAFPVVRRGQVGRRCARVGLLSSPARPHCMCMCMCMCMCACACACPRYAGASAAANAATGAADAAANAAGSAAGAGGAAAGAVAAAAGKAAGASESGWMHREMIPIDRLPSPSHLWAQPRDWF